MKKKFLWIILATFLVAFSIIGCSKGKNNNELEDDYGYNGEAPYETMTVDTGITLDGELNEDVWKNCKNTLTATSDVTPYYDEETQTFKYMNVHTYFGENGIYVAFEVFDNGLYYNEYRQQTRNTGVELYFADLNVSTFGDDVMSIRVTPTGEGTDAVVSFWRGNGTDYMETKSLGDYLAAAKLNGTLNSQPNGKDDDIGYVVELAISYDLFGGAVDIYHYTASFIQMADYNSVTRYGNSFLAGTSFNVPATFKAVTNDGVVTDKIAYMDQSVEVDEGVNMDGKLTEAFWVDAIQNDKGKDWTQTGSGLNLNIYTHMTDLGVYIGLDCNDSDVYYSPDRAAKYNTGAEVFVVPMGETSVTTNAKQFRYNVGGAGERFLGDGTSTAWRNGYFPARVAGAVKGDNATVNTSEAEGWTGEIFVPWQQLGVTNAEDKTQIAVQANVYHSPSADYWPNVNKDALAMAAGWKYVYANSSFNMQHNPQENYFLFTKADGFVFNATTATNASIDQYVYMHGSDILANNEELTAIDAGKDYYYVTTRASVLDGGIKLGSFTTSKTPATSGTLEATDDEELIYEYIGDGEFRIYYETGAATLSEFEAGAKNIVYRNEDGGMATFKVSYDAKMAVNGIINEADAIVQPVLGDLGKAAIIKNEFANSYVTNGFSAVTDEDGLYGVSLLVKDTSAAAYEPTGVTYYIAYGDSVLDGVLKVAVDFTTSSIDVMLYDGLNWLPAPALKQYVQIAFDSTQPTPFQNENDVTVEFKIDWEAFNRTSAPEFVKISPTVTVLTDKAVLGQFFRVDDLSILDMSNFLRFGEEGFAPDAIYAQEKVLFIHDDGIADGGSYSKTIDFSYLGHGGLNSDTAAPVAVEKATVEALNDKMNVTVTVNELDSIVSVEYVNAKGTAFDYNKLAAYLNFDHGAENLDANTYTDYLVDNKSGEAFVEGNDYVGDKYFNANMKQRSVKVPVNLGNENFIVSMMIDGSALRSFPAATFSFILFGTGNVDKADEGFSVRMRGDAFSIRTNNAYYSNIPFDMSKLDGWKRLTFSFRVTGGSATVYIFVEQELIGTTNITMEGSFDVSKYGTLGIGGPGSVRDTETGYNDINIGIDDVLIVTGNTILDNPATYTQQIYDMVAYAEMLNAKANFGVDARKFDYNFGHFIDADDTVSNTLNVTNNVSGEIKLGGEWEDLAAINDGVIEYELNKEQLITLASSQNWYEVDGFKKYVQFNYAELSEIEFDDQEKSVWGKDKIEGFYNVELTVTSEGTEIFDGLGLTFAADDEELTATYLGGGRWSVAIPANVVEALADGDLLTVTAYVDGNDEIASSEFTVEYKRLASNVIADLAKNTSVLIDFENNTAVNEMTGESATSIWGTPTYDGGAYVSNVKERYLVVPSVSVGTESFTVSAMINVPDLAANTVNGAGRKTTLFGTCDVDGKSGFSVGTNVAGDLRIVLNGTTEWVWGAINYSAYSGYERFTFVFNREETDVLNFKLYVGTTLLADKFFNLDSNVSLDYQDYTMGIGCGGYKDGEADGNRGTGEIRFEDFIIYDGIMPTTAYEGIDSHFDDIIKGGAWYIEDVVLNYENVTENQDVNYALQLVQVGNEHSIANVTFTGLIGDATITNGNLNVPYAQLDGYKTPVIVTATINGISKTFTITYYPLNGVYAEKTAIEMWGDEKTGDNYEFTTKVYVDEQKAQLVQDNLELTFKLGTTTLSASRTANAGEYTVAVPKQLVEKQAAQTIIVTTNRQGVDNAAITFTHKYLDDATVEKLVAGTESYLSFDDTIFNYGSDAVATMALGTESYAAGIDGKAIKLNPRSSVIKLAGQELGATSFTMSFDLNVEAGGNIASLGNDYELIASKYLVEKGSGYYDSHEATFQLSYRGQYNIFRMQTGASGYAYMTGNNWAPASTVITPGAWQRVTIVVERGVASQNVETVKYHLYIDGSYFTTYSTTAAGQTIGFGDLFLGGDFAFTQADGNIARDHNFLMDNFVLYRGVMTADEVRGLTSANSNYYDTVVANGGVAVEDVTFGFNDVNGATEYEVELNFLNLGKSDLTGATLVTEAGFTLSENGGVYTLTLDEQGLEKAKNSQTLTMKWGEMERSFTVSYISLENIYLDVTEVEMWGEEKNVLTDTYDVEVRVYSNESKTNEITPDLGITLVVDVEEATIKYETDKYIVSLPAAQVEKQTAKVVTISVKDNADVTGASFTFTHKHLDDATVEKLVAGTESYLSFENDSMIDVVSGKNAEKIYANSVAAEFDNGAYVSNVKDRAYGIQASIGTSSFTVAATINVADLKANAINGSGRKTTLFGTGDVDSTSGISVGTNVVGDLRIRVNGVSEWAYGALDFNSTTGYERFTFVFDRSTPDVLNFKVYQGTTLKADKNFSLASAVDLDYQGNENKFFGIGAGGIWEAAGDGSRGTGDIRYEDFMLYNGVMTADEIRGIAPLNGDYYTQVTEYYGVAVEDVTFGFNDVNGATEYEVELELLNLGKSDLTGATLVTEAGFTLSENGGVYTLTLDEQGLEKAKNSQTLTMKWGEMERSFTVSYVLLDTLYVSSVSALYEFEKNVDDTDFANGYVYRDVKVSTDEAGNVGISNVDFGEEIKVVSESNGIYTLKIPYKADTYELTHAGLDGAVNLAITLNTEATTIVKDTDAPGLYSTHTTDPTNSDVKQGGKKYEVANDAFGTGSFSLSVMVKDLSLTKTGGAAAFFTNSNVDAYNGFVLYTDPNAFRFRAGTGSSVDTAAWLGMGVQNRMSGWHHLVITFDRSAPDTVTYTVYLDGANWGSMSFTISSDKSFDVINSVTGKSHVVIGSVNRDYEGTEGYCRGISNADSVTYGLAGAVVTKGIIDVEVASQYVKHNVQAAVDSFEASL